MHLQATLAVTEQRGMRFQFPKNVDTSSEK